MKKVLMLSLVSCLFIAPITFAGGKGDKKCCNKGDKHSKEVKEEAKPAVK